MTPRQLVYYAIDSEREFQIRRWGYRRADNSMIPEQCSIGDFLVKMGDYLREAEHRFSQGLNSRSALTELRKVVALGVACFEQHGIDVRHLASGVINARDQRPT